MCLPAARARAWADGQPGAPVLGVWSPGAVSADPVRRLWEDSSVRDAFRELERRHSRGKIVLRP